MSDWRKIVPTRPGADDFVIEGDGSTTFEIRARNGRTETIHPFFGHMQVYGDWTDIRVRPTEESK